jgi:hypothetical protein
MPKTTLTLTSAQLLALRSSPVDVIAAPGAGKATFMLAACLFYEYVTTAYTIPAGALLAFVPTGAAEAPFTLDPAGFLDSDSNQTLQAESTPTNLGVGATTNVAFQLTLLGGSGELTLGDGTLRLTITYNTYTA